MALYRITDERLEEVRSTSFSEERILERRDLQRLLKSNISVIGEDLMVLAEEFGDWEESNRRIDLLCLDKQARLVIVEIKRTEDGGHMELQAIRYAAMVSNMTLDRVVAAHARMLNTENPEIDSRKEILDFLQPETPEEITITDEVRIILLSADFSKELSTSVLWLNKRDVQITCIRLKPYKVDDKILIDATQIIPLPETEDYEVKAREQEQETRKLLSARHDIFRRFWFQLIERSRPKTHLYLNRSATTDPWLSAGIGRSGFGLNLSLTGDRARVECYIRLGKNGDARTKTIFNVLRQKQHEIETKFGEALEWEEQPGRAGCRIYKDLSGGWRTPEAEWPDLQDRMIETIVRLEAALKEPIQTLRS